MTHSGRFMIIEIVDYELQEKQLHEFTASYKHRFLSSSSGRSSQCRPLNSRSFQLSDAEHVVIDPYPSYSPNNI